MSDSISVSAFAVRDDSLSPPVMECNAPIATTEGGISVVLPPWPTRTGRQRGRKP